VDWTGQTVIEMDVAVVQMSWEVMLPVKVDRASDVWVVVGTAVVDCVVAVLVEGCVSVLADFEDAVVREEVGVDTAVDVGVSVGVSDAEESGSMLLGSIVDKMSSSSLVVVGVGVCFPPSFVVGAAVVCAAVVVVCSARSANSRLLSCRRLSSPVAAPFAHASSTRSASLSASSSEQPALTKHDWICQTSGPRPRQ
jgi:hypothetical protein